MNDVQTGITTQPSDAIDGAVSVAAGSTPNLVNLERRADELAMADLEQYRNDYNA